VLTLKTSAFDFLTVTSLSFINFFDINFCVTILGNGISLFFPTNIFIIFSQSWFKNRRFKWRKEVKQGPVSPPQRVNQELPTAKTYLPVMYQSPYVYNLGHIPLAPCKGCCPGKPTNEPYYSAFYQYSSY